MYRLVPNNEGLGVRAIMLLSYLPKYVGAVVGVDNLLEIHNVLA